MKNEEKITNIEETNAIMRMVAEGIKRSYDDALLQHHLTFPTIWMDKDGLHARNPTLATLASWEEYTIDEDGTYHLIRAKEEVEDEDDE